MIPWNGSETSGLESWQAHHGLTIFESPRPSGILEGATGFAIRWPAPSDRPYLGHNFVKRNLEFSVSKGKKRIFFGEVLIVPFPLTPYNTKEKQQRKHITF